LWENCLIIGMAVTEEAGAINPRPYIANFSIQKLTFIVNVQDLVRERALAHSARADPIVTRLAGLRAGHGHLTSITPEPLQVVELSLLLVHYVDDDITEIQKNPPAVLIALHMVESETLL
jgi:hypothetical protein